MTDFSTSPETATPTCCYCDAALSCACCGREQPADHAQSPAEPVVLEQSEDLNGHQMVTVRSNRGDEYVIDVDAAVKALAQLFSDHDNERRFGWQLERIWFQQELSKLRTACTDTLTVGDVCLGDNAPCVHFRCTGNICLKCGDVSKRYDEVAADTSTVGNGK
jgi:hypothetical protein